MVDSETIETKISDEKEETEENFDETTDKFEDKKDEFGEKFEETKEKGKNIADNVISDLYKSIDEFKDSLKNMQKTADQKYNDYKKATVQSLDVDLIETEDVYYIKAAVPGIDKDDILIEAGDNDITIEATFKAYIEEFEEDETAEVIASSLKSGKCIKTIRFENSLDIENISAKFNNGTVTISIPKLVIPKHKVNVE
ncbi:Hsp20/alpha crystallin family protein [Methanobrevibacter sp.]|uniref:Hsp20/alpha crystallin family protein n=1 Tax=Methanobrevibacter sp. TaxID=66852 RepID=UPI0025D8B1B2|nr:Hsp20/alpha crystallin family protein [Methanobrevibacter sp.]MBQ6511078.1 Hsp20/alpha crystallin family protein [Methanobrevibacter sp.]